MTFTLSEIIAFLITYFICSISPAIIICKLVKKEDIRNLGSGNAGTTNSARVLGKFWGLIVFIFDIMKVILAYLIIDGVDLLFRINMDDTALNSIFLVAAVIGHCYPIYYGLKGGKGVAVLMAAIFLINKELVFVCVFAGIVLLLTTRIMSIASIGGTILLNIMIFVMYPEYILPIIIVSCIIIFKHRSNIERIIKKEESKIWGN